MSDKNRALLASFGRVFAAAALAAYLNLGKAPLDLRLDDAGVLFNAGVGAALLTLVNYLRDGDTRFGRKSEDIGMGGADKLEPPTGQINPDSVRNVEVEVPVQTDNTPKDADGEQLPEVDALGEADWTSTQDMR